MITYSGVHIQKIGGAPGLPTPTDIAVHAGRICRFGGALWYPLLPHLIFVGLLAYKRSDSLQNFIWGVLHDAHEVATSDVPRPFKCDCMRNEQSAIDQRLLLTYFSRDQEKLIDYDLIKLCDHDACDIEAVELGLPNFSEIELAHTKDYRGRTAIHSDITDVDLFQRVHSAFGGFEVVQGEESSAVRGFITLLEAAEQHDLERVQQWIDSWGTDWLRRN